MRGLSHSTEAQSTQTDFDDSIALEAHEAAQAIIKRWRDDGLTVTAADEIRAEHMGADRVAKKYGLRR